MTINPPSKISGLWEVSRLLVPFPRSRGGIQGHLSHGLGTRAAKCPLCPATCQQSPWWGLALHLQTSIHRLRQHDLAGNGSQLQAQPQAAPNDLQTLKNPRWKFHPKGMQHWR